MRENSQMTPRLRYDQVEISFGGKPVVQDVSLSLNPGEILGLVGESGSGKSTLIKAAMGLLGPTGLVTRGDIWFGGKNLPDLPEKQLRRIRGREMGMIFQDAGASLCPIRTIGDQMLESMAAHGKTDKRQAREAAGDLLGLLGFSDPERIWNSYPFELSGGMNQRVGIAMAMVMHPAVLLADEPTSALDVAVQRQVVQSLLDLRETFGTSILLVSHDIGVVSAAADTIAVLQNGNLVEYGPAKQILEHPRQPYTKQLLAAAPKLRRN